MYYFVQFFRYLFFFLFFFFTSTPSNAHSSLEEPSSLTTPLGLNAEELLKKHIHYYDNGPNTVGYFYVGDHESMISQSTWIYIKKGLEYYQKSHPSFIILELDTPGGEVFAAQKISDALKEMDIQFDIPIVAFINNWAISAGAMLAYSSRFIITVKDGSMGAAEPVFEGEKGTLETASEKINSALRADFANRAGFFDRNPLIAEAMVDKRLILVLRNSKITKLDNENQIRLTEPNPDIVITSKGKLLTLTAEDMIKYGVADYTVRPEKLSTITPEEKEKGSWPLAKTLLNQIPFFAAIPQATIDQYKMDWKTQFFAFLATPLISSILFMGLMIGAYLEISNPGLSLPGTVAAICLFLIILSYFSLEIASWLELILLLTGIILILIELFVTPTFGFLGVVGIVLFFIGLFGILIPELKSVKFEYDTQTFNAAGQEALARFLWFGSSFIISLVIIAFLARYALPRFKGFQRFVLQGNEQDADRGFVAGYDAKDLPQVGEEGIVFATLRPAGKIVIKDKIYDALSYGGFIDAGEPVKVVRLEGSVIVVNRLNEKKEA